MRVSWEDLDVVAVVNRSSCLLKKRALPLGVTCKAGMVQGNSSFSHGVTGEDNPSKRHAIAEELIAASPHAQKSMLEETSYAFVSTKSFFFFLSFF